MDAELTIDIWTTFSGRGFLNLLSLSRPSTSHCRLFSLCSARHLWIVVCGTMSLLRSVVLWRSIPLWCRWFSCPSGDLEHTCNVLPLRMSYIWTNRQGINMGRRSHGMLSFPDKGWLVLQVHSGNMNFPMIQMQPFNLISSFCTYVVEVINDSIMNYNSNIERSNCL